jgi:hypothetical protein
LLQAIRQDGSISAVKPVRGTGQGHEVVQLAVCDAHQRGNLVIVQLESDGDHVIAEAFVPEPDRDCM